MQKKCLSISLSIIFFFLSIVPAYAEIVINEFLPHPSSGNKEWVEFYNPEEVDIKSYWIDDDTNFTDDKGSSTKKILTTLLKGKDPFYSYIELSSMLNNSGDYIVLFDSLGTIVDQYEFTEDPGEDIILGRFPNGQGEFAVLQDITQGDVNSMPLPTATPTSLPAATPTPTPKMPTPTKEPTPTRVPTQKNTPNISSANAKQVSKISPTGKINLSGVPTAVLGANNASQNKSIKSPSPENKNVLVKDIITNKNTTVSIAVIIGGACILACGILMYFKMRSNN